MEFNKDRVITGCKLIRFSLGIKERHVSIMTVLLQLKSGYCLRVTMDFSGTLKRWCVAACWALIFSKKRKLTMS